MYQHREPLDDIEDGNRILDMTQWCGQNLSEDVVIRAGNSLTGATCVMFQLKLKQMLWHSN